MRIPATLVGTSHSCLLYSKQGYVLDALLLTLSLIFLWMFLEGEVTRDFVVARNDQDALLEAKAKFGDDVKITQDEDVLDTWFR